MNNEAKESRFEPSGQPRTARRVLRVGADFLRRTRAADPVLSKDRSQRTDPSPPLGAGGRLWGDGDGARDVGVVDRRWSTAAARELCGRRSAPPSTLRTGASAWPVHAESLVATVHRHMDRAPVRA